MKERPILFNTEMVQAILQGRKTQTRRVIKANIPEKAKFIGCRESKEEGVGFYFSDGTTGNMQGFYPSLFGNLYCPYGQVGDILWVRESFSKKKDTVVYRANVCSKWDLPDGFSWKPSIHMPKDVARIFLKIKDVRIERLFDISEIDSQMEGVSFEIVNKIKEYKDYLNPKHTFPVYAKLSFISLWEKINGEKSLELNPWVWVVEFERIEKPKNF